MKLNWAWTLKISLGLTLGQIGMAILMAPHPSKLKESFLRLNQWDSYHYSSIVEEGYHLPPGPLTAESVHSNQANVAYFPAYPWIVRAVKSIFGISTPVSLLIVAQLFCFLFWIQFLSLLIDWEIPKKAVLGNAWTLALFPSSFYLITGYSESLFLASLVGLILWTERWLNTHSLFQLKEQAQVKAQVEKTSRLIRFQLVFYGLLAGLSGFLLTSSRLVGVPLFCYPVLRFLFFKSNEKKKEGMTSVLILSLVSGSGALAFFIGCQIKFNQWDLYFKLQELGWKNIPNYLAFFDPRSYIPRLFFEDTVTSVCRASNFCILIIFFYIARYEWLTRGYTTYFLKRCGLYFLAGSIFFISLAGKANAHMDSMVRYNLPVFILQLLALALIFLERGTFSLHPATFLLPSFLQNRFRRRLAWILLIFSCIIELWMIHIFTKGGWVA